MSVTSLFRESLFVVAPYISDGTNRHYTHRYDKNISLHAFRSLRSMLWFFSIGFSAFSGKLSPIYLQHNRKKCMYVVYELCAFFFAILIIFISHYYYYVQRLYL